MLPTYKIKSLDGLKRLEGLLRKVKSMIEDDAYCPHILENLLAMHGHVKHVQAQVLESHLHTCAKERMKKERDYDRFIAEVISTIGLSRRS
jgi:DNA-binding FrmR family transcriptional regulator